ncbi:hypothetical protein Mal35_05710 [Gimesia maris]|nr:hypothetical protein Mal35_05710 [Gimesia maris]
MSYLQTEGPVFNFQSTAQPVSTANGITTDCAITRTGQQIVPANPIRAITVQCFTPLRVDFTQASRFLKLHHWFCGISATAITASCESINSPSAFRTPSVKP